jgi:predicted Zn-dependent peptidase
MNTFPTFRHTAVVASFVLLVAAGLALPAPAGAQGAAVAETPDQITYPPLADFDVPKPRREVLDNGLVVLMVENHELPLVQGTALIETGSRFDPADRVGLAEVAGQVMSTATETLSSDELARLLEDRAATISSGVGTTSGSVSFDMLSANFAELFPVVADVLRRPAFDPEQLEIAKTAVAAEIARQNDDSTGIAFREAQEIVYGEGSPYARDVTYESLASIDRDALVDWHRRAVHPERVILALYGDFDPDQALALVRRELGDWQAGAGDTLTTPTVSQTPTPGIFEVVKTDVNQSTLVLGHLGVENDDPDYFAIQVLNEVLSGGDTSRLYREIRNERGLAYAVGGGVGGNWDYPGTASVVTMTKTETTEEALGALLTEVRDIRGDRPPTDAEVADAKERILSSFVFNFDQPSEVLQQQLLFEYYDYPRDWIETYPAKIEAVTPDQVRAAAREHLRPEEFTIVVVGNREGRDGDLSRFGTVTARDITIPEPPTERAEASEETMAGGRAMVAGLVEAMGGAAVVDAVEALRSTAQVQQQTPMGAMDLAVVVTSRFPDRMHQQLTLPQGQVTVVTTPEGAFAATPMGVQNMPPSQAAEQRREILRTPLALVQLRDDEGFSAVATGEHSLQVEVAGDVIDVEVDPETGLVASLGYRSMGPDGTPTATVESYSDWRDVGGGLMVPHGAVVTAAGEELARFTIESVEINPELPDDFFAQPEG